MIGQAGAINFETLTSRSIRDLGATQRNFAMGDSSLDTIIAEAEAHMSLAKRRSKDPRWMKKVSETAKFVSGVFSGDFGRHGIDLFEEAMTTSDFPILFGDVLDRALLGQFQSWPSIWPNYIHKGEVRDFRIVRRITNDGLDERWYPQNLIPEMTAVQELDNLAEGQYTYGVQVYEKAFAINWRMLINDDLGAFQNLAPRLASGAKKSEDYFATAMYVSTGGPNATYFSNTNKNLVNPTNGAIATNPPLSIAGLQDAMSVILSQVNPQTGEPIMIDLVELVVPPGLKVVAENIVNATQLWVGGDNTTGGGGDAAQRLITNNWMRASVHINVNPYLPMINTTSGKTAWYLFANPANNRPAAEIGFLRGYDAPALFQKLPNTMRLGGGVDPLMGDFDTMEIVYKGMHIFGGTTMSPQMAAASTGTGS